VRAGGGKREGRWYDSGAHARRAAGRLRQAHDLCHALCRTGFTPGVRGSREAGSRARARRL